MYCVCAVYAMCAVCSVQLHAGMTPVNCIWEAVQPLLLASLCRLIAIGYVIGWDSTVASMEKEHRKASAQAADGPPRKSD